ncbi:MULTISPECIES: ATP-binding protein [unclassified Acidovorax]|uniref:ATP-binding protein n=1 Tax=unclassified Acidovorax TaxID=2684926 RepID=UPI001C49425A|nr:MULTISPECIES: ATP-binding protein [unclassified Acidovorax]MBV7429020.1 sensor histidine kinase [Acidovorax sp. sif0732]MBV7450846.1 sensor histidine kinase [Acidovorax sp. sif0715]
MNPLRPDAATALPQRNARSADAAAGIKNLQQLIQLRWIAVVGQVFTIEMAHYSLGLVLPQREMLLVVGCLALFNVASLLRLRMGPVVVRNVELFLALLIDVAVLTVQLYLSGGTSNPFVFLYLLQITLGAVLLRGAYIWSIVITTLLCFGLLAVYHLPLELPQDLHQGLSSLYVIGLLVCFALNATLVVVFITRISLNLRERDARLAAARRRRVEEEHIVRMGLLASGAAHELGTPLSTLAVILGDWRRDERLAAHEPLQEDIGEMQAQVQRCKSIVSGILLSAGETRGEASVQTTVRTFVDALAEEWRSTRSMPRFVYDNDFGADTPMVSDTTLQQMVFNVLDNARDASPAWVRLAITRSADALRITVTDAGPGFAPGMLARLGTPYQSTKERPGGGLGLYLVLNVARTLGGSVTAHNRPEGGAEVTIELPLAAIALPGA